MVVGTCNKMFSTQVLCYTIITLNVLRDMQCTTITVINPEHLENTDITLNCSNDGKQLGIEQWILGRLERASMSFSNNKCIAAGFITNNSSLYAYDCTDGTAYVLTLKKIPRDFSGSTWTCGGFSNPESNAVTIYVKVPVKALTISPYTGLHTASENSTLSLQCTTSECRPEPSFLWYKDNNITADGDEILLSQTVNLGVATPNIQSYANSISVNLTRELNGWYIFCAAVNYNGSQVLSEKILLNITYPPDGPPSIIGTLNGSEVNAFRNDVVYLVCVITGGNPLPILSWERNDESTVTVNDNTITANISWLAIGQDPVDLICQSLHPYRNDTIYVTGNILYPPEKPVITVQHSSSHKEFILVENILYVIEGKSLKLNCSAVSNPLVSLYQWNDLEPNTSSIFYVANTPRATNAISCNVSNEMKTSDSRPTVIGNNITRIEVNVLYAPKINMLRDSIIIEGENLDYLCDFTLGNPNDTNITWSWKDSKWTGQRLLLHNVSRNQEGIYTCSVQNWMNSSDGIQEHGNDNGRFNLSVQYKAKVVIFMINEHSEMGNITVNENDAINISCELEGRPLPTGELFYTQASYIPHQQDETRLRNSSSQKSETFRLNSYFLAQCTDIGPHTCRGRNTLSNGLLSTSNKSSFLFVNCKPRKSPFFTIPDTVLSPKSVEVTLSFTTLAYPIPHQSAYVWTRKLNTSDNWMNITNNGPKTIINTSGLQSNLTIKDVTEFDYGMYKLLIFNDVGQYTHTFSLIPAVYRHEVTTVTESNTSLIVTSAAGAAGGVAVLVAVIFAVLVYIRRKGLSNTYQKSSSQYHSFSGPKVAESNISAELSESKRYDGLQHTDTECNTSTAVVSSNVYDRIQNIGFDHEYKQSSLLCTPKKGERNVYENLQLNRMNSRP